MLGNFGVAKVSILLGIELGTLGPDCGHISCCTMHGNHMSLGRSNLFMNPTKVTMYQCLTTERSCYGWTVKNEIWYCLYIRFTYVLKALVVAERWKTKFRYIFYTKIVYVLKALVVAERWKMKFRYIFYTTIVYVLKALVVAERWKMKFRYIFYTTIVYVLKTLVVAERWKMKFRKALC